MDDFLNSVLRWSEVWGLLIPLIIIISFRQRGVDMRPIVLYVWVAFILNLAATIISVYHKQLPSSLQNNNILYNLHSLIRVLLLAWYFISLKLLKTIWLPKIAVVAFIFFAIMNCIFFESPLLLSSRLFAAESIVLLLLSILYFFRSIQDDSKINWMKHPSFLVCAGVSLYEAISFFIFLFFYPLFEKNPEFGVLTMKIYSVAYIIFCILLALALYKNFKQQSVPEKSI